MQYAGTDIRVVTCGQTKDGTDSKRLWPQDGTLEID